MLDIRNIVKQYASHRALDDVSLTIPKGQIFGLLGPNGAGKTSLIRIINQITAPDAGEIYFDGQLLRPEHVARIGYLPEERGLYKKMEIGEQMVYLAQLKGLSKADAKKRIIYWFEKLGMESWWTKKVEDLSKGMQQKVQFVATVLHNPELIFLDEPFSGFDPVNAKIIQDEILQLNEKGATIIYSTHRMESVEELCDHIALIHQSKKILDGAVRDIKARYRNRTYTLEYSPKQDMVFPTGRTAQYEVLKHEEHDGEHKLTIRLAPSNTLNEVLSIAIPQINIHQVLEIVPSMNDIFIQQVTPVNNERPTHYA